MTTVSDQKVYCPFCSEPLKVRLKEGVVFMPLMSDKGHFQVRCRSSACKGRWIDIDIKAPAVVI